MWKDVTSAPSIVSYPENCTQGWRQTDRSIHTTHYLDLSLSSGCTYFTAVHWNSDSSFEYPSQCCSRKQPVHVCSLYQPSVSSCDVLVVPVGHSSMPRAINVVQKLWSACVSADITYDVSQVGSLVWMTPGLSCTWVFLSNCHDLFNI